MEWKSIIPPNHQQAQQIINDPTLSKRIPEIAGSISGQAPRTRGAACKMLRGGFRQQRSGPTRTSPTPGRTTEYVLLSCAVAGWNQELADTDHLWLCWQGDASTAFLQVTQEDASRPMALYMYPPSDGLISKTNCWNAPLYELMGNIYGLPNAPCLWTQHVVKILLKLGYVRHAWECMLFLKYNKAGQIISMVMIYVDDFIGIHRQDYKIDEVHNALAWGELAYFELDQPKTFKGKELTFTENASNRVILKISMSKFLETVEPLKIAKGRLQQEPLLTEAEKKDYRSLSGCLQWLASQARPDVCPAVSLSNHGLATTIHGLKVLQESGDF